MSMFEVQEEDVPYKDVCDHGASADPKNIRNAFSGLRCPSEKLHEWSSQSKNYTRKFIKAKQCMQRRITRMKNFSAETNALKEARRKHIYPIEVAYAFGKNCARKIGTQKNVNTFTKSTDELIRRISELQPDIKESIPDSLNSKIQTDRAGLHALLKTPYYSPEQWNIIHKYREGSTNGEVQSAYNSIIDTNLHSLGYRLVPNETSNTSESENKTPTSSEATTESTVKQRKRRIQKLAVANNKNAINLNAFIISKEERNAVNRELYTQMTNNWLEFINAKNNVAIGNLTSYAIQMTHNLCSSILSIFPTEKRRIMELINRITVQGTLNNQRVHDFKTGINMATAELHKTMRMIYERSNREDMEEYIHKPSGLMKELYQLIDDRKFSLPEDKKQENLSLMREVPKFHKFINSSYTEINTSVNLLSTYILEQDKLETLIKVKNIKEESNIGKLTYAKLNDVKKKMRETYLDVLTRIDERIRIIEEFSNIIPKINKNPFALLMTLMMFEKTVTDLVLFDPSTY